MYYGPVMIDLSGLDLLSDEKVLLAHPRVGGVILFSRNYQDVEQLKELIKSIRKVANKPLLITVDHEGGRVWRFNTGFTKLPPLRSYGVLYEENKAKALRFACNAGRVMASELLDCGIDLSLAPVVDLDKGVSKVIGDRAFHRDPAVVVELASAFIAGMNEMGMSAIAKHFPGHGGCAPDSHIAMPVDARSLAELKTEDMIPFIKLSALLGAVMPAHITYPAVDNVPTGFSSRWLQDILRQELKFGGAVISDCLSMKGAAIGGDFVVRAQMALDAGCDMVILCQQDRALVSWIVEHLARDGTAESTQRLALLAGKFHHHRPVAQKPVLMDE